MKAINLRLAPVELDPANGPGMLGAATAGATDHERELAEVTEREQALARAGVILLVDSAGRRRKPAASDDDGGSSS